jgi:hypothetical protein
MAAEFCPEAQFEDGEPEQDTSGGAKAATEKKTDELAQKIRAKRETAKPETAKPETKADPAPEPQPAGDGNPWPAKCSEAFAIKLGSVRFTGVLESLGLTLAKVSVFNKQAVWDAMNKELAKDEESNPGEPNDLF